MTIATKAPRTDKPEPAPQPVPEPASDNLHPAIAAARKAALERMEKSKDLPPIVNKPAPSFATKAAAKKTEPEPKVKAPKAEPKSKAPQEPEVPLKPAVGSVESIEKCVIPTREEVDAYRQIAATFIAAAKEFLDMTNLIADKPWPCAAAIEQNACEAIDNVVTGDGQGLRYAIEDAETLLWIHDPAQSPAPWVKALYAPKSKAKEVAAAPAAARPTVQRRPQPAAAIKSKGKKGKPTVEEIDPNDA